MHEAERDAKKKKRKRREEGGEEEKIDIHQHEGRRK
jgi:hypothetical protein